MTDIDTAALREGWEKATRSTLIRDTAQWADNHVDDLLDEVDRLRATVARVEASLSDGSASDGFHTFDDLYAHRRVLHAHAAAGWIAAGHPVVKSWRHSDGELAFGGGWFIVVATLPAGQVSYHYEAPHWGAFNVPEVDLPPTYDGHTPADVVARLAAALTPDTKEADRG